MSARADDLVDRFFDTRAEIFAHVGYVEGWRVLPLDDSRDQFWAVDKAERELVRFSPKREALVPWIVDPDGALRSYGDDLYQNAIYTQRHLPKWVYRGVELTLVVVDTQTDGNKLLQIFRNANEVKVHEACDHMHSTDLLTKTRLMCAQLPISGLRDTIEVHRRNCQQPSCPVLTAMEELAGSRTEGHRS